MIHPVGRQPCHLVDQDQVRAVRFEARRIIIEGDPAAPCQAVPSQLGADGDFAQMHRPRDIAIGFQGGAGQSADEAPGKVLAAFVGH